MYVSYGDTPDRHRAHMLSAELLDDIDGLGRLAAAARLRLAFVRIGCLAVAGCAAVMSQDKEEAEPRGELDGKSE